MCIMAEIPDINDTELWVINTTLQERFGFQPELQLADSEVRLSPADRVLSNCPLVYWKVDDCNFVVIKTGDNHYRCQFFYRGYQQYGTGRHEYDDLAECLVDLLQVQADHAARERGDLPAGR
jgi:hypothetical protein